MAVDTVVKFRITIQFIFQIAERDKTLSFNQCAHEVSCLYTIFRTKTKAPNIVRGGGAT